MDRSHAIKPISIYRGTSESDTKDLEEFPVYSDTQRKSQMIRGAKLQTCLRGLFLALSIFLRPIMSSKSNSLSVSPGTVLSVVCLLLYYAGFVRIKLKFNDHDQRLTVVEEVISQMKHGMVDTWNKGVGVSGYCLRIKYLPLIDCLCILY